MSRRRSRDRSRSSRSSSDDSSSRSSSSSRSRSPRSPRRVDAAALRRAGDADLLEMRRTTALALDRARERASAAEKSAARRASAKRARDDADVEEGQIRARADAAPRETSDEPPGKVARGYVPPHARQGSSGGGRGGGFGSRSDVGDWRRRDGGERDRDRGAKEPKLPVPGERGFGFKSIGLGRGSGIGGGDAPRLGGDGAGRAAAAAAAEKPLREDAGTRFADAPRASVSAAPREEPKTVSVPPPPPVAVAPKPKAKSPSPPPREQPERREEPSDDEDDDIEAIQAAAKAAHAVSTKAPEQAKPVEAPRVVEIECEIPDKPAAAAAPRRSSRRSVSVEREKPEPEAAPRRSSRRSVSVERAPRASTGGGDDDIAAVNGDLSKLTVVVLKKLLSERGLSVAGLKATLVDRLQSAMEEEKSSK